MPVFDCPECDGRVSTLAPACPHCGAPAVAIRPGAGSEEHGAGPGEGSELSFPAPRRSRTGYLLALAGVGIAALALWAGMRSGGSLPDVLAAVLSTEPEPAPEPACTLTAAECAAVERYGPVPDLRPGGREFARVQNHLQNYSRAPGSVALMSCTPPVPGGSGWDTNCLFSFDAGYGVIDRDRVLLAVDSASVRVVRYLY